MVLRKRSDALVRRLHDFANYSFQEFLEEVDRLLGLLVEVVGAEIPIRLGVVSFAVGFLVVANVQKFAVGI
jgi:hypothetical protein